MAKANSYITQIRAQVKADHDGEVPKHLELTIRNYALALEMRDIYRDQIIKEGAASLQPGSTGQPIKKQHPLCGLLYQQEMLCLSYAKALGSTSAKAATKVEQPEKLDDKDPMTKMYEETKNALEN